MRFGESDEDKQIIEFDHKNSSQKNIIFVPKKCNGLGFMDEDIEEQDELLEMN